MTRPPLDLEAIRQRVEAATDAEWQVRGDKIVACDSGYPPYCIRLAEVDSEADALFIAHAREDVPDLLAEVERLRSGIETVLGLTSSPGPRAESILRDLLGGSR